MQHKSNKCFVAWEICLMENEMLIFMEINLFLEQVSQLDFAQAQFMTRVSQGYCTAQLWQKLDTVVLWPWLRYFCVSPVLLGLDSAKCSISQLAEDMLRLQMDLTKMWGRTHHGFLNCPNNTPSLGLSLSSYVLSIWSLLLCKFRLIFTRTSVFTSSFLSHMRDFICYGNKYMLGTRCWFWASWTLQLFLGMC